MKKKNKNWSRPYHKLVFKILYPIFKVVLKARYNYSYEPFKVQKGENYLVLCNHSCSMDPFFVGIAFHGNVLYYMSTDDLLKTKAGFWISLLVKPIPKKKQVADPKSIKTCLQVAKEKGNICIFPEGNRTFSGEGLYVDPSISKLAKALKMNLVIYNIENGYGVDPRWGGKERKGYIRGKVRKYISKEDIAKMGNDELYNEIAADMKCELSYEHEYKSKAPAEYLERVLYVCPKCHSLETLKTDKDEIYCTCGLKAKYNSNLTFSSDDESFTFKTVADWYNFQKNYIRDLDISQKETILSDDFATVDYSLDKGNEKVMEGKLSLTFKGFTIKNNEKSMDILFDGLLGISVTGKHKVILFNKDGSRYTICGNDRFNAYKYAQMSHKILNKFEEYI